MCIKTCRRVYKNEGRGCLLPPHALELCDLARELPAGDPGIHLLVPAEVDHYGEENTRMVQSTWGLMRVLSAIREGCGRAMGWSGLRSPSVRHAAP